MNKNKKKTLVANIKKTKQVFLIVLFSIILLFAVLIDLHKITKDWFIFVERDYISYVYAALATVSTISITVLSLIINSLDKKYFGVPIKVYLNMRRKIFRIKYFIPLSLIIILFSTFLLSKNMVNTLCVLFSFIIAYISYTSIILWDLITNDEFCFKKISEMIMENKINKKVKKQQILNYLFNGLYDFSESINKTYINDNVDLIIYISNQIDKEEINKKDYYNKLSNSFKIISDQADIIIAINEVYRIINSINISYSPREIENIIIPIILKVQYLSFVEYQTNKYNEIIIYLEKNDAIKDEIKINILYKLFESLYNNEIFTNNKKVSILNQFILRLMLLGDQPHNYNDDKQKVLLMILKYKILNNTNYEQAQFLMKQLLEAIDFYSGLSYKNSPNYFETVALIYLIIYLYSESEVETLIPEHREKIKELINLKKNDLSPKEGTFKNLINLNFNDIIVALLNINKMKYDSLTFLENFTDLNYSKSVVWDSSSGFDFAMCNFYLSYKYHYPHELITNWDEIENKMFYLQGIQEFFVMNNSGRISLISNKVKKIDTISKWIDLKYEINAKTINNIFFKNNELIKKIYYENIPKINFCELSKKIKTYVNEKIINSELEEYSNSVEIIDDEKQYYFGKITKTDYLQEQYQESIIDGIYENLIKISYNEILKAIDQEKDIKYNKIGIEAFIEEIKYKEYSNTNFDLKNELFYFKDKIKSENWVWIENSSLEKITNKYIKSKVIYKDSLPKFNVKLNEYKIENLSDNECEKYSEKYKISNEYYKIDNAYYTKSEVMDIISNNYRKVAVIYIFKINKSNSFSGFKLKFDYTKLEEEI